MKTVLEIHFQISLFERDQSGASLKHAQHSIDRSRSTKRNPSAGASTFLKSDRLHDVLNFKQGTWPKYWPRPWSWNRGQMASMPLVTVGDLLETSENELLELYRVGPAMIAEVKKVLSAHGLALACDQ